MVVTTNYENPSYLNFNNLKPIINYAVSLLLLLLIGYGQLFGHAYKNYKFRPPLNKLNAVGLQKTIIIKPTETEYIYIEEGEREEKEEERINLKEHSKNKNYSLFFNFNVSARLFRSIINYSSFFKCYSPSSFFRSPYLVFGVFRL